MAGGIDKVTWAPWLSISPPRFRCLKLTYALIIYEACLGLILYLVLSVELLSLPTIRAYGY